MSPEALLAWADHVPAAGVAAVFAVVGLTSVAILLRSAYAGHPACRFAWVMIALTCLFWTIGHVGVLLGWPQWSAWAVTRPISLAFATTGILAFPGLRRSPREWALIVVDGWMSVGGIMLVAWLLIAPSLTAAHRTPDPRVIVWALANTLMTCALAGLLARAPASERFPVAGMALGSALASAGDLVWALTGDFTVTAMLWIVLAAVVGLIPLLGGPDLFSSTFIDRTRPPVIRLSQLPLIPAGIYLFAPLPHDLVADLIAAAVIAVCFTNVTVHSLQSAALLRAVSDQRSRFEAVLMASQDAIMQLRDEAVVEFVNPAVTQVLGYAPEDLIGTSAADLVHPGDLAMATAEWAKLGDGVTESVRVECRLRLADRQYRFMESTAGLRQDASGWVLSIRDVTSRVALREELAHQARTDPLTGLLNRAALLAAAGQRLERDGTAALLFIDLDDFKSVNDTLGHAAGDGCCSRSPSGCGRCWTRRIPPGRRD